MANHITLTGRLVRDPEVRYLGEKANASFSLAVERTTKNAQGKHDVDFINCVAWGKVGEVVGNYVHKGSKVYVEGRLQTRSYNAKDGSKRYVTEVVVSIVEFLSTPGTSQEGMAKNSTEGQAEGFNTMEEVFPDDGFEGLVF